MSYSMKFQKLARTAVVMLAVIGMSVTAAGCGKGSKKNIKIEGVKGPYVNFVDDKLTMSVVLENAAIDYGVRIPIYKLPNSYVEVGPDFATNGYLITVGLDAMDVRALLKDNVVDVDPTTLPGGRPIPGITEGELPGFAIEIPKWNHLVIYGGNDALGVFVPVKLPWKGFGGSFRFYDGAGTRIGNIAVVGADDEGKNAGFLLLVNMKGKVGDLIGLK